MSKHSFAPIEHAEGNGVYVRVKSSIAFPFHDPDLQMFPHLQAILPDLKALFTQAYICPPLDYDLQEKI